MVTTAANCCKPFAYLKDVLEQQAIKMCDGATLTEAHAHDAGKTAHRVLLPAGGLHHCGNRCAVRGGRRTTEAPPRRSSRRGRISARRLIGRYNGSGAGSGRRVGGYFCASAMRPRLQHWGSDRDWFDRTACLARSSSPLSPSTQSADGELWRRRFASANGAFDSRRCFGAFVSAHKILFPGNGDWVRRDRFERGDYLQRRRHRN